MLLRLSLETSKSLASAGQPSGLKEVLVTNSDSRMQPKTLSGLGNRIQRPSKRLRRGMDRDLGKHNP